MESRKCSRCDQDRPLSDFGGTGNRQTYCRACHNAYMREWKKQHRENTRQYMAGYRAKKREREDND